MPTETVRAFRSALLIAVLAAPAACATRPPLPVNRSEAPCRRPPPVPRRPRLHLHRRYRSNPPRPRCSTPISLPACAPASFWRTPTKGAIDQQLDWYASNPDYLQRAFGRADMYLYYIVAQLEARRHAGSKSRCCRSSRAPSSRTPTPGRAPRDSGSSFPAPGSRFGLKQDWWYDGRRDIVDSTNAALDYLQALHDEFNGDWLLAIAAYNCGEIAVEHAVQVNRSARAARSTSGACGCRGDRGLRARSCSP